MLLSQHRLVVRVATLTLIACQVAFELPMAAQAPSTRAAATTEVPAPLPEPKVTVNRTVPTHAKPAERLAFSPSPTVHEIFRARVFSEPLVAVGGVPSARENRALADALLAFHAAGGSEWRTSLGRFLAEHPTSPWVGSLRFNIGVLEAQSNAYASALAHWDAAWEVAKTATEAQGRAVADSAVAEWLMLMASFGQVEKVDARLAMLGGRSTSGPAAVKIAKARETIAIIRQYPALTLFCGPESLLALLEVRNGLGGEVPRAIREYEGTFQGATLRELERLASEAGLELRSVAHAGAHELPVPSIVHWKLGHYVTVVERDGERYRIVDRTRRQEYWLARDVLLAESSGYFLTDQSVSDGWREASNAEKDDVRGSGPVCPDGAGPPAPPPCGPQGGMCGAGGGGGPGGSGGGPGGNGGDAGEGGGGGGSAGGGPNQGLVGYAFQPVTASLLLYDTPVGYTPPRGPSVPFTLSYHQREWLQPQLATYANLGPKWTLGWVRFVKEQPTDGLGVTPPHTWVMLPPGGREVYTSPDVNGVFPAHWNSRATLVRVSQSPVRYERRLPDGTVEVYEQSDGAAPGARRIFMTELIDPHGQSLAFTWDAQFRLVAVTDATGQVSTLQYTDVDPLKVTGITDPYGRQATLEYNGAGQLEVITDVLGLQSRFAYGDYDFVSTLTTPYGQTSFRHESASQTSSYGTRFIEATDPIGGTERMEFQYETPSLAAMAPTEEVPSGFEDWNERLNLRNTFFWDKRAWASGPGDLTKAVITHWLEKEEYAGWQIYSQPIAHSIKRPLENRVWYAYPGQSHLKWMSGSWNQPSRVGRILPGGASQIQERTYNDEGMVLTSTDPVGRQTTYEYAANGTDLVAIRQTTGGMNDLLATYSNYVGHRPQIVTDAAGGTTTYTYNAVGQVLTVTNPLQETTAYAYNNSGQVTTITGADPGAVTAITYDAYGRPRTVTDAEGFAVTTDYDVFDRPVRVTYPDGTFEETIYDRLDVATRVDRARRRTAYFYDPVRRLVGTRDPLGRTIVQEWCECGALDALIDGKGQRTSWERDAAGRVSREIRPGGSTDYLYTYDSAGRLSSVTDPKDQVTTYSYTLDDQVAGLVFTNAQVATPSVSYTYEASYPRLATMVDGTGTTAYTYKAAGQAGAGQVATADGPLVSDTIVYSYDAVGRVVNRAVNGVAVTWDFDSLGRVVEEVNVLGTFEYGYVGATPKLASVNYPNGQTSTYSYLPVAQNGRLQTIHHKYPGGATLSRFDYTYDAVGNILTWRQQADSDPAVLWRYGYDPADQLTAAVKESTGQTPTVLQRFGYGYDAAGNRRYEQVDQTITLASHDALNRLTTQVPGGAMSVVGALNEPGQVTIDGKPVSVDALGAFTGTLPVTGGTNTFTVAATDVSGNSTTQTYELGVTGQTRTFMYDANGNMTSDGTRTFEWDARNQLVSVFDGVRRNDFNYDGLRRRTKNSAMENGIVQYESVLVWCGLELCEERPTVNGTVKRFLTNGEESAGQQWLLTTDHLGSTREAVSSQGVLGARNDFDPWGRRLPALGSDVVRTGFTGHITDTVPGLVSAPLRDFDPLLGQWISEDPAGHEGGLNLYSYVQNSPIRSVDPLGLAPWDVVLCWWHYPKCSRSAKACAASMPQCTILDIIEGKECGSSSACVVKKCFVENPDCQKTWKYCYRWSIPTRIPGAGGGR